MNMDWSKVKEIAGTVAPTIATIMGGPLAGMATTAVSQAILGKDDAGPEELVAAFTKGGPEALTKLKEAEYEFKSKMAEAGVDLEKVAAQDRESARDKEAKTGDKTPRILAFGIILAAVVTSGYVLYEGATIDSVLAGTVLGYLFSEAKQVTTYYFGSSAGSSKKNEILEGIIKK